MSTEKSLYGLVTPEENLITQLAGYVGGGRSIQMTTLVGVLQLLEQWSTEITSLNQQLSAKIISEQNIINAFGIPGEGAHSKLVIEYVHGLVAENSELKGLIEMHAGGFAVCPNCSHEETSENDDIVALYRSTETTNTDAFTAELRAQGADTVAEYHKFRVDALIDVDRKGANEHKVSYVAARDVAANLRAGRKG